MKYVYTGIYKLQNIAKEGFSLDSSDDAKAKLEALTKQFEPLTKWLNDEALKGRITKAVISERLRKSPCALVANVFGWTGELFFTPDLKIEIKSFPYIE